MNVNKLIDDVYKIANTSRQRALREFWTRFYAFQEPERIPVTVGYSRWMYSERLGIDLVQMFRNAKAHLESTLIMAKAQREWFRDDGLVGATFGSWNIVDHINAEISLYFGPPFDTSMFGVEPVFAKNKDPVNGKAILKTPEDLDALQYPDFYTSGMMPLAHEFYEYITKRVKGKLEVAFPRFIMGPWGIAWALRGLENLLIDTFRRPDFVHKLMSFITESRIRWEKERESYLGSKTHHPHVDSDEVDCGVISPRIYKDFILPYEKRLADFYGGEIFYYHSCGNLAPILDSVLSIPGLKRIEISPWTDLRKATELLRGKRMIMQRRVRQIPKTESEIKRTMEETLRAASGCIMEVDAVDEPLGASQRWTEVTESFMRSLRRSACD